MILSLNYATNFQYSMVIEIFCRTERKSLRLVLPCVLLRQFPETRMINEKTLLTCQILWRKCGGERLLQALKWHYFGKGTRIILREFLDRNDVELEIYLYDIYYLVASLIITLTFHCTLYLIHNEWSRRLEKIRGNINCFEAIYKCFVHFIYNILPSPCIGAMFF